MKEKFKEVIKKNYTKIIFAILLIIGIIVRVWKFPEGIPEINIDEIMTAVNAKSIAETGKDILEQSFPVYLLGWGGQSVVLAYLMAICVKIFGYTLFAIRIPTLIISIISLVVFYDFIKKITDNKNVALVGLGLLVISPWHIMQSIWSLDCNMFPHFLLFAMDILVTGLKEKRRGLIYLSMFFFALTLYCYGIAIYFVPFFLLIMAIYLVKKKKLRIPDLIVCIAIFIFFALPIVTMFFLNGLGINKTITIFNITIPFYENLNRTTDMLLFSENKLEQLLQNILDTFSLIILQDDKILWNTTSLFGTTYHITLVFVVLGIIDIVKRLKKKSDEDKTSSVMLITWLTLSTLTGFLVNQTNANRLNSIWYVLIAIGTLGIWATYKEVKNKKVFKYDAIAVYAILFILFSVYFYKYHVPKIDMSTCFSNGFYQSLIYANDTDKKKVYFDDTDPRGRYTYYLTLGNDETKEYIRLTTAEEVQEKIDNLQDDEIILANEKFNNYESDYEKERIRYFVLIYK